MTIGMNMATTGVLLRNAEMGMITPESRVIAACGDFVRAQHVVADKIEHAGFLQRRGDDEHQADGQHAFVGEAGERFLRRDDADDRPTAPRRTGR